MFRLKQPISLIFKVKRYLDKMKSTSSTEQREEKSGKMPKFSADGDFAKCKKSVNHANSNNSFQS